MFEYGQERDAKLSEESVWNGALPSMLLFIGQLLIITGSVYIL
jgi:hypothetical protein